MCFSHVLDTTIAKRNLGWLTCLFSWTWLLWILCSSSISTESIFNTKWHFWKIKIEHSCIYIWFYVCIQSENQHIPVHVLDNLEIFLVFTNVMQAKYKQFDDIFIHLDHLKYGTLSLAINSWSMSLSWIIIFCSKNLMVN